MKDFRLATTLALWTLLAGLTFGPGPQASAQALAYSSANRTIKACNLVLSSQVTAPPVAPYLFYLLDSRPDLKPAGWQFENPLAPPRADDLIRQRWGNVYGSDPIGKNMAAYWEVYADRVTPEDLAEFDIIYVGGSGSGSARGGARAALNDTPTTRERELLRRAVDAGAVLWLEDAGAWRLSGQLFFGATFGNNAPTGTPQVVQPIHPLLNEPYRLSSGDLESIFPKSVRSIEQAVNSFEPVTVQAVLRAGPRGFFVATGPYGSGQVAMLGSGTGALLSSAILPGTQAAGYKANNKGPASGNNFSQVPPAALKFAYNLASLTLTSPQERGTTRRTGSSLEQVGAPLTRKWNFPANRTDPVVAQEWNPAFPNAAAPAVYKGVVFVPAANGFLYAFDLDPARDIDGDGNPDDGTPGDIANVDKAQDLSRGAPYDVLWKYYLADKIQGDSGSRLVSSPVVGTINGRDTVFVSTEDGAVWAFDAFPTSRGRLQYEAKVLWTRQVGSPYTAVAGGRLELRIPSPVLYAGRLFVAANDDKDAKQGKVMELDPVTGNPLWQYSRTSKPLVTQPPALGRIVATPAMAWIQDQRTEAMDLVLYVPTLSDAQNGQTGRMFSFLISVRNERLDPVPGDPRRFRSRHAVAPQHFPWLQNRRRVWVPANSSVTASYDVAAPGQVQLSSAAPAGTEVRADYDVDPTADQYKPRSTFFAPPPTSNSAADFLSTPVVGPDSTVYVVASDLVANRSTLYAVKEQAPLAFVRWRYSLPQATVLGPPAYYKGVLYLGTSDGRIMGFDTRAQFRIDLSGVVDLGRKYAINFLQRDPMLPSTYAQNSYSFIQGQYDVNNITTVDPVTGNVSEHGQIIIKQFSIAGSNALDASQPITVKYPVPNSGNQAEETTEIRVELDPSLVNNPDLFQGASGNRGNKIFDRPLGQGFGASIVAGPTIAGDVMYVADAEGRVGAFPADPRALTSGQGAQLLPATIPLPNNPSMAIPGPAGLGPLRAPIVAVNGNLVLNTAGGVMVFHQPVSLIADANRLLEVRNRYSFGQATDEAPGAPQLGGSEVLWSLNSTERKLVFPKPGNVLPVPLGVTLEPEYRSLSHPAVALRLSNSSFLVADTGNNRVVEVDRGGQVIWELTSFADPLNILGGSETLTISTPTDIQRWYTVRRDAGGNVLATETHTLIVDGGNHRVLEIRDTYPTDPRSGLQEYHVLVWASRTTAQDKSFVYRNAQRLPDGTTIATVLNYSVNSVDGSVPDTPGSSVVVLSPRLTDNSGRLLEAGGRVIAYMGTLTFPDGTQTPLQNPVYFQRFFTGRGAQSQRALLVDGLGVYELEARPAGNGRIDLLVRGSLRDPANPQATVGVVSAKRLASGNTLIVNQSQSTVYEYDEQLGGVIVVSPITQGTQALVQPTYADRSE